MVNKAHQYAIALLLLSASSMSHAMDPGQADLSARAQINALKAGVDADPSNPDLLQKLAAAQAAAGQYVDALETIERAQSIAPLDNDIALARARILFWAGRVSEAKLQSDIVRARAPNYPGLDVLDRSLAAPRPAGRSGFALSVGLAKVDPVAGQSQNWENFTATAFAPIDALTTVTGSVEHERRAADDTRLSVMASRTMPASELRAGFSYTPNADFKENWGVQVGADFRVHPNVTLISDARFADYAKISVLSVGSGAKIHNKDQSQSLTLKLISLFPSDTNAKFGVSARVEHDVSARFRLFAGAASYPDTEAGVTRQLRSAFGGGSIALADNLAMIMTAEYDRRDQSYTRKAVNIALIFRLPN